ncbi:MAG: carcinine hydrolase/isopenicillin-N N-acyltransferase family protein [Promethearchaeota archaeon]
MKNILSLFILISSITIPTICAGNSPITNVLNVSPSCTIFTIAIGNTVLFGNNEDYLQRELCQWYVPSQNISIIGGNKSIYGGVFVGIVNEEEGEVNPQGGMNEHGLMFDVNGLPGVAINENANGSSFYCTLTIASSLWDCKNVEEVIEWFKAHKWNDSVGGQIHYGDAKGDAVVVSVNPSTNKWAFTKKTGNFIISTNFNLNDTNNGYYPCGRYETAKFMLSQIENEEDLTVQACADILYAVHQDGEYGTLYSNIFDPVKLEVYFNYGENYQKQKKVNLLEALSQTNSFEKVNASELTGVDGNILVKTVRIDENFYSSSANMSLQPVYVFIFVFCVINIYKRRRK